MSPPRAGSSAARASASRPPRQERGRRLVDAILDATAELLVENGLEAVTMHGVARRARTAIGSMYHFFPDRDALLGALAARHGESLRAILAALEDDEVAWGRLSIDESIERSLGPLLAYIERHPDVLLMRHATSGRERAGARAEFDALLVRAFERVVGARAPGATAAARRARAATIVAMLDGVASMMARPAAPPRGTLARELRRAAAAYVAACEREDRSRRR